MEKERLHSYKVGVFSRPSSDQTTRALFLCNYIPTYPLTAVVAALPCLSRFSVYFVILCLLGFYDSQ